MSDPVDVELMTLADGVLERAEADALKSRIAANPALASRLAVFEATRREALQRPFDEIMHAQVPDRLIAAVMGGSAARDGGGISPPAGSPRRSAEVLQFRRPEVKRKSWTSGFDTKVWAPASVAAAMLAVLAAGAWQRHMAADISRAPAPAVAVNNHGPDMSRLGRVLDTLASSTIGAADDGSWSVKPVNTFQVKDGRWCRELNLKGEGSFWAGLACRSNTGSWQMQAFVEAKDVSRAFAQDGVRAAGGEPPEAIGAAVTELGGGRQLNRAEEQGLIAQGWKK